MPLVTTETELDREQKTNKQTNKQRNNNKKV